MTTDTSPLLTAPYKICQNFSNFFHPRPLKPLSLHRASISALGGLGNFTIFAYDEQGNNVCVLDARGNAAYFAYDVLNRQYAAVNALGDASYFFYDAAGNQIKTIDAEGRATYFKYDALERQSAAANVLFETTYFEYDDVGNRTAVTDPLDRTTQFYYDAVNRLVSTLNPASETNYFIYDDVGNRVAEVDGAWQTTYYSYDALRRLQSVTDALVQASYYVYDAVGNLEHEYDARERATYYTYDEVNRKVRVLYHDDTINYYAYDKVGNLDRTLDARGGAYFAYDVENRLITDQEPIVGTTYFSYDAVGNRTGVVDPDGGEAVYWYDAANRMASVVSPEGNAMYYVYDKTGLVTKKLLGNLSAAYFSYDDAGRLSSLRNAKSDGTPLSYFDYTRLANGNVSQIVREDGTTISYDYDDADRLTSEIWKDAEETQIYAFTYEYDKAGNRTKESKNGVGAYYYYDAANQLTQREVVGTGWTYFAYDANGSMVTEDTPSGTTYFEYADNGLVSRIVFQDTSEAKFHYDARLQRFAVETPAQGLSYFQWDGLNLVMEKTADGTTQKTYTHGRTPIGGIGSMVEANDTVYGLQYPATDNRGSVHELEDESQTVKNNYEFNAFGEGLAKSESESNRFTYHSNWFAVGSSTVTHLFLVSPYRVYDPTLGRFLQRDAARSINRYSPFADRPTANVDPTGLFLITCSGLNNPKPEQKKNFYDLINKTFFDRPEAKSRSDGSAANTFGSDLRLDHSMKGLLRIASSVVDLTTRLTAWPQFVQEAQMKAPVVAASIKQSALQDGRIDIVGHSQGANISMAGLLKFMEDAIKNGETFPKAPIDINVALLEPRVASCTVEKILKLASENQGKFNVKMAVAEGEKDNVPGSDIRKWLDLTRSNSNLQYVITDSAHTYKSVVGSEMVGGPLNKQNLAGLLPEGFSSNTMPDVELADTLAKAAQPFSPRYEGVIKDPDQITGREGGSKLSDFMKDFFK